MDKLGIQRELQNNRFCNLFHCSKKPIFLIVCAVLCLACAGNNSILKDGYYTAEAAQFDEHGWKEYVTVCVSDGRIILIEYNAFNPSGFIKSWDMSYMRVMNVSDGIYPNAYVRFYTVQAMSNQGTGGVEALSGATNSYKTFIVLTDAALENARLGLTETRLVDF